MTATFIENPMFWSEFDRALGNALEAKVIDIRNQAKRYTTHPSVARKIKARASKTDAQGPYAVVTTGGGLGNIFEGGTATRRTRAGANRGSVDAERFIEQATESELIWGLDNLSRYL